jgi:SnoaL-like domain
MTEQDLNDVIAGFREALRDYVKGDPEPAMSFLLRPRQRHARQSVGTSSSRARRGRRGGTEGGGELPRGRSTALRRGVHRFEEISRFGTSELGYVLQIERHEGNDDTVVTALRATLVFRCEDGVWKIAHRHADPITSTRPLTTILRS